MNTTIEHNFRYHPPTVASGEAHAQVRAKAKELALLIDQLVPVNAGREKATAITHVENAMMWACAGIVRQSQVEIASASGSADCELIARASQAVSIFQDGAAIPEEIQWMPPGAHDVEPFVEGEPKKVKGMKVTAQMADQFNSQLQYLRSQAAAGLGDVPFIDFNHNDDTSAGEVLALYWGGEDPKSGGIRAKVKWSAAGRDALEGKNYRRFSPQWFLDPKTLQPIGVGINLGGLVNRAAFKTIARVVAKDASASTHNTIDNMTKEEFQQLLADGLKPINDKIIALEAKAGAQPATAAATAQASTDEKITLLITNALKPVTEKLTQFETNQQNTVKAQAKAAVQVHVARGAIAPEDKTTVDFFEGSYLANASAAEAIMSRLPGKTPRRIINNPSAAGTTTSTGNAVEPENRLLAKARELREKNPTAYASDASALDAIMKTPEARALYEQFRDDVVQGAERLPKQQVNK